MFQGVVSRSFYQCPDERAKQLLSSLSGIVNELEKAEVDRQFFLRNTPMRSQPGAQQRPEAFHRIDVDLVESVAVFIAGIFARAVVHALVLIAPLRQAGVDVVFVGVDLGALGDARLNHRFDRRLLDVGQHVQNNLPAALDQTEDGRFFLRQRAAAARSLEATTAAGAAFFWVASGWPLWPATT